MVTRLRPQNLSLLVNPASQGIDIEAQASSNLARSILGAAGDVGQGIARGRAEKESRRRYDREQSQQDAEFSLRQDELLEKKRERQASEAAMLDGLDAIVGEAGASALTGQPLDPRMKEAATQLSGALGGPEATMMKMEARSTRRTGYG